MTPQERIDILRVLEDGRREFNAAAAVSESQATASPAPGRWSVLEIVEHVGTVEDRFLGWLQRSETMETPRVDPQREADLAVRVRYRTNRAEAPEVVRPADRFTSLAESLEYFNAARARTIRFADERASDLYSLAADHPRFGALNGIELMVLMAGHALRHADQIREARAAVGA